jgi:hypothetical protein
MSKNRKKRKKKKVKLGKKFYEAADKVGPPPAGFLAVPHTTTFYQCCGKEDGAPVVGCGFKFAEPQPANVVCPKCGNVYVKWLDYEEEKNV